VRDCGSSAVQFVRSRWCPDLQTLVRFGSILIVDRPLSAPAREALRVIAVLRTLPYENNRPGAVLGPASTLA